jgi:hypothetical protein
VEDFGPEGLLGTPDGQDAQTLRDRLALALRYLVNWYRATDGANRALWWPKIDALRAKIERAYKLADPAQLFLGNTGVAAYTDAANDFPALWRELSLASSSLLRPDLLDRAAPFVDAVLEAPGIALTGISNSITKGVGGALGSALGNLWPYLLLAGGAALVYVFRVPLARLAERAVPA